MINRPQPMAALQAAITAGSNPPPRVTTAPAAPLTPDYCAAVTLLRRVQHASSPRNLPLIVQFLPCEAGCGTNHLPRLVAEMAAKLDGRTLLAHTVEGPQSNLLKDVYTPKLHHQDLSTTSLLDLLAALKDPGFSHIGTSFKTIIISHGITGQHTSGYLLAPFCSGTILVARQGRTELACIRAANTHVKAAGGTVLGITVIGELPGSFGP